MKFFKKISQFFKKQESLKIFTLNVTPRAIYEGNTKGGVRVTLLFEKTIKKFGKTTKIPDVVTFDNYHRGGGNFSYIPSHIADNTSIWCERSMWEFLLGRKDCEDYPLANVTKNWLNKCIDEWLEKNKGKLNFTLS